MYRLKQIIPFLKVAEDRFFDWRHNINTTQWTPDGIYATSRVRWLRMLFDKAQEFDMPRHLVDVGCGAGKISYFALANNKKYKFKAIWGFDNDLRFFEKGYFQIGMTGIPDPNNPYFTHINDYKYRPHVHQKTCPSLEIGDATTHKVRSTRSFIVMYNPFGPEIMQTFLSNNLQSCKENKHLIGYINDTQRHVFEELGFTCLWRDADKKMSLWRFD